MKRRRLTADQRRLIAPWKVADTHNLYRATRIIETDEERHSRDDAAYLVRMILGIECEPFSNDEVIRAHQRISLEIIKFRNPHIWDHTEERTANNA